MPGKHGITKLIRKTAFICFLLLVDVIIVFAIFMTARYLRVHILPLLYAGFPPEAPFRKLSKAWWIFPVWLFFLFNEGLYNKRFSFWDEVHSLWRVAFFSTIGIFTIVSIEKLSDIVSRASILLMGAMALLIFPLVRIGVKRLLFRYGGFKRRVLILGAGATGRLMLNALRKEPNYGYDVIGFLDDDPAKAGGHIDSLKVHRGVARAASYLKRARVTDVIIAMPGASRDKLQELINSLQHKADRLLFVPDMHGIAVLGTSLQHFFHEQAFALELKNNLARPVNILLKRVFDLIVGTLLLPLVMLSIILIGVLIKLDSPGPVIYSQERVGKRGRMFRCMKFRTMFIDAEERLSEILGSDTEARKEWERFYKLKEDPRITRIGRFLRATSLDELPQLFHVLSGRMSLVGPRPVTREEIDTYYREAAELCFRVPPGITGLWQVTGRSGTTYEYRVGLDSWYVRNWNVWLDIVILFKTVGVVIKREGAW